MTANNLIWYSPELFQGSMGAVTVIICLIYIAKARKYLKVDTTYTHSTEQANAVVNNGSQREL